MNYRQILDVELGPTQSLMAHMNEEGDAKIIWDRSKPLEVSMAQTAFDKARKEGYMAYKVSGGGAKGEILHTFDPQAERIILAPPLQGGR